MLQLLIIINSLRIIGLLSVNCIFIRYFLQSTQPKDPSKTKNFVTQLNQVHGWTRPMSNFDLGYIYMKVGYKKN